MSGDPKSQRMPDAVIAERTQQEKGAHFLTTSITEDGDPVIVWQAAQGEFRARLGVTDADGRGHIFVERLYPSGWGSVDKDDSPVALGAIVAALFLDLGRRDRPVTVEVRHG